MVQKHDAGADAASDEIATRRVVNDVEARLFGGPPVPVEVGRFRVDGKLGEGGLGVVYAAHDPALQRTVALKILHRRDDQARLFEEARAMARVAHPNVVVVHEVGTTADGRVFIAMERVAGRTLRAWLNGRDRDAAKRAWRDVVRVLLDAGRGLAAAHHAGLVHRDFKPENVLVGDDGRVRVTDFGLARAADDRAAAAHARTTPSTDDGAAPAVTAVTAVTTSITVVGDECAGVPSTIAGTPAYMAPEQHAGERAGAGADVFAFCATAWEALSGRRPYDDDGDPAALVANKCFGRRTSWSDVRVPVRVRHAIARGLAPEPARRYATIDDAVAALEKAARPTRALVVVVAAVGVAVLLVASALQMWMFADYWRRSPPPTTTTTPTTPAPTSETSGARSDP